MRVQHPPPAFSAISAVKSFLKLQQTISSGWQ
jgi:hypothetical protein